MASPLENFVELHHAQSIIQVLLIIWYAVLERCMCSQIEDAALARFVEEIDVEDFVEKLRRVPAPLQFSNTEEVQHHAS
jgi:hypothetical protein